MASLIAQRRLKEAERERLRETIKAQRALVATLVERVNMRTTLVDKNSGTRASVIDSMETYLTQQATLAAEQGQLGETEAAIEVASQEILKAKDGFLADNLQKLAEAQRQADDAGQRLARARAHTEHMTIRAPIAGLVNASSVTTVGQVASVGEELMRIVPDGSQLEIEAYLPNKDIGSSILIRKRKSRSNLFLLHDTERCPEPYYGLHQMLFRSLMLNKSKAIHPSRAAL